MYVDGNFAAAAITGDDAHDNLVDAVRSGDDAERPFEFAALHTTGQHVNVISPPLSHHCKTTRQSRHAAQLCLKSSARCDSTSCASEFPPVLWKFRLMRDANTEFQKWSAPYMKAKGTKA